MLITYKKYYFIKNWDIESLKDKFDKDEIIILENTDPLSAMICHQKKKLADYSHIQTRDGINKYLSKKKGYNKLSEKEKDDLLKKAFKLGKFVISKNERMLPGLGLAAVMVSIEVSLVWFLLSLPALSRKEFDFLIVLLEIVGTTLTFFFSISLIEPESHGLMLESYDKDVEKEAENVNKILSFLGLALFIIGFFLQLQSIINS